VNIELKDSGNFDRSFVLSVSGFMVSYEVSSFSCNSDTMEENIVQTNLRFGGVTPYFNNVLQTTQGVLDPWTLLGIQEDKNEDSPIIIIPGKNLNCIIHKFHELWHFKITRATNCEDFDSISENDPPELKAVKKRVFKTIRKW
jgi:hypothetical protein